MNVNNFNPFERHVEKIALAVAAVAAGYMIYIALPPMLTIEPTPGAAALPVDQVEPEVTRAVDTLQSVRDTTRQLKIRAAVDDFVAIYKKEMQDQPLPEKLVDAGSTPMFVPRNIAIGTPVGLDQQQDLPIATPTVPNPTDVSAIAARRVFALVMPAAGGAGAAQPAAGAGGAPVPTADKDIVLVRAFEDMGAFLRQMADPDLPPGQHLPPSLQRAVITKVELQRRERLGAGWTAFENVPPTTASTPLVVDWSKVADSDLQNTLTSVEQQFKQVAQPEYFPLANGGSVVEQLIGGPGAAAPGGAGGPGGVGAPWAGGGVGGNPGMMPGAGAPVVPDGWTPPGSLPGGMPAAGARAPAGSGAGAQQASATPIWAIDDHVEPGKEYQYRMRVSMYNPTYHWPHALKQPEMRNKAILTSDWVLAPNTVEVQSNMYFFIMGPIGRGGQVSARVYRWNAGRWYANDVSVEAGVAIAANIRMASGVSQEVSTGFTVVDVVPVGNDVNVVLMDANGRLSTRLASADRNSPTKSKIEADIAAATPPPVAPAPTTRPAGITPRPLFGPAGRGVAPGGPRNAPPSGERDVPFN